MCYFFQVTYRFARLACNLFMFYHHRAKDQDSRDGFVGQFDDLSFYSLLRKCWRSLQYTFFFMVLSSHLILHHGLQGIATIMHVQVLYALE